MRLENEVRFGFSSWDWKESPNVEHMDRVLRFVNRGAGIEGLSDESGSDSYLVVMFSVEVVLRPDQWYDVYRLVEGQLNEDDPRLAKFENSFAQHGGQTWAMKREDLEEFVRFNQPKTTKITDPDIARRGTPFFVNNEGNKEYLPEGALPVYREE